MAAKPKYSPQSPTKESRYRALIFAPLIVALLTAWTSVASSQNREFIPPHAYQEAMKQWAAISGGTPITSFAGVKPLTSGVAGLVWKPTGPGGMTPVGVGDKLETGTTVNGRIDSIAVNPNDPNVIYIGATDGGVWKTLDAGSTWTPLTDHEPMLGIGEPNSITIDPSNTNILYVGTSINGSAEGIEYNQTLGIMKSTDGGGSWIVLGSGFPWGNSGTASQFAGQNIFGIAVDPDADNHLYLAASKGLYYSTDAGENWTRGKGSVAVQNNSLAFDASSPPASRVLFAGVYGVGIQMSTNGARKWKTVLDSTTPAVAAQLQAHSLPGHQARIGKISVSLAPPVGNSNGVQVVYASIQGIGGDFPIPGTAYSNFLGIFETMDQGKTWTFQGTGPTDPDGVCQCDATNNIAVDPGSPGDGVNDVVYWGGTGIWLSHDSGVTFAEITNGTHVDSRSWGFAPGTPTIVYAGNDGGIWRSTDQGNIWSGTGAGTPPTLNTGGLQTGLIYHMDIKRDPSAGITRGAFQDNGQGQSTGALQWQQTLGGDGSYVVFDQQAAGTAYSIENNGPFISTDSGSSWSQISQNLPSGQISHFDNTLSVDPNTAGIIYFGGGASGSTPGQLFQSLTAGSQWTQITNFSTGGDVGSSAVSPANSNNLAVAAGTSRDSLFISANVLGGTPTFTQIPGTPGSQITRIAFDPNDANALYFVTSGFAPKNHVFRVNFRVSAGTVVASTVTAVSPALNVPFDAIALDGGTTPTTIYAGSVLGVLRSVDGGTTWTTLDALHFPNAIVTDLQINPVAQVLRASTFGRGVFEFAAATGPVIALNPQNNLRFGPICSGRTVSLNLSVFNVGSTDLIINSVQRQFGSPTFRVAPNPTTPVRIGPNAHIDFTVQFSPASLGHRTATIAIASNDPAAPTAVLTAAGRSLGGCP